MNIRDQRQKEHARKWIEGSQKEIALLCVRFGKIKMSIDIMHELLGDDDKILIAYPDKAIKNSWLNDFKKWAFKFEHNVTFTTYASLGKHVKSWDFIILDEIHEATSEKRLEILEDIFSINDRILGLTGTLTKWSRKPLEKIGFKISSEYTIEDGIADGILPDYEIHVHKIQLNSSKVIGTSKKGNPVTEKSKLSSYTWVIEKELKQKKPDMKKVNMMRLARMRLIMESPTKKEKVHKILEENRDKRMLIFSGTTRTADEFGDGSHHSNNSEENNLQKFINGEIDHISLCKIGDTGITYPMLDGVVFLYTSSNSEDFEQKIGRTLIFDYKGKVAKIIIVSSDHPVESEWLNKAMENIPNEKIRYHKY